jgi:DNA-binding HxlR family transcriptional regulator
MTRRFEVMPGACISANELKVLHAVRELPNKSADYISAALGLSSRRLSATLRRLKNDGFVRIRYAPMCVYTLTAKGFSVCEHAQANQD